MKILICSKLFYPSNSIGAVRPSNFAKYLAELGHQVTVISEEKLANQNFILNGVDIIRISNSIVIKKLIQINQLRIDRKVKAREDSVNCKLATKNNEYRLLNQIKLYFLDSLSKLFFLCIEFDWASSSLIYIKKKYDKKHFDIVFSTYGPTGSFLLGLKTFRSDFAKHWISDLRDNMVNEEYPIWLNLFFKNSERKILKYAKVVTVVSEGQKAMLINNNKKYCINPNKIFVIPNGYEEIIIPKQLHNESRVLKIAYTGQLYSGKRDFSLLFHVIDDLIRDKIIDKKNIEILYAGPSNKDLRLQINQFDNIKFICKDMGNLERNQAWQIQNQSDLLVVLTWNTHKEQGILTGKFFEYLQSYKPIISITCGDLANGELTKILNNLKLGIACEYITYEEDYKRLREYLVCQYNIILNYGYLDFAPDLIELQKFHYHEITKCLNSLCNQVID